MKGQNLPPDDRVVRVVQFKKLRRDEYDNVLGISHVAFERRPDEEGLSVTWLEYFAGDHSEMLTAAVQALRASEFKPSPKSGFAVGQVGAIKATCLEHGAKIRIIHVPTDDNKAHAEVRQLPSDNIALLEALAAKSWSELVMNAAISPGDAPAPDEPATRATLTHQGP